MNVADNLYIHLGNPCLTPFKSTTSLKHICICILGYQRVAFEIPALHSQLQKAYFFENYNSEIYRLDLTENEELEAVEKIGSQPGRYYFPVLFQLHF